MRPSKAVGEDYASIYLAAAQEHRTLANEMHQAGRYVMSHYISGLAVECLLRAYRYRIDPVFDSRHNLQALYTASGLGDELSTEERGEFAIAMTEVARRWSNTHRFRSEKALRNYLRRAGLGRTGKFVKESSRCIVNATLTIVDKGVLKWRG